MAVNEDPFASFPDADPAENELRKRAFAKPEKACELLKKPKAKQKKVDLNPLQRRHFEREGWTYARVETSNAWGGVTNDMWKIADYLAVRDRVILLVQTTTASNAAAREKKARNAPELGVWLAAGGKFQVHAWKQPSGPGTRWEMQVREMDLAAYAEGRG